MTEWREFAPPVQCAPRSCAELAENLCGSDCCLPPVAAVGALRRPPGRNVVAMHVDPDSRYRRLSVIPMNSAKTLNWHPCPWSDASHGFVNELGAVD